MSVYSVYPDRIVTEYHDGTSWVDISRYVVSDLSGDSGMASPMPDDRVAALGVLTLELNNDERLFTPYGGDAVRDIPTLTGWKKGAKVRISIVIGNTTHAYWVGRIADLSSDSGTWGTRRVRATLVDWMDVASRYPMRGSDIQLNKRVNEAAELLLERLSIQPEGASFDVGNHILSTVFSNIKDKTVALSELNKLMMSEWGFAYITRKGELRIENSSARPGTRELDVVPVHPSLRNTLALEDGDGFVLENGEPLALDEVEEARLAMTSEKLDIEMKDDVINAVNVKAYPARTASVVEVVARLGSPIRLKANTTTVLTLRYTDPNGGAPISATDLQDPVLNTDYVFNTEQDGSGSNIGANITVTPTYYGDQVDYVLTTDASGDGWLTTLQARGFGIYYTDPISIYISDEESIEEYGDTPIEIDQRYQDNLFLGDAVGRSVVEEYKTPKSRVKKARFLANLNHSNLMACVHLDIGSLLKLYDNRSEMHKWYYITARSFTITLGKVIHVTYTLVEAPSIQSGGLTPVPLDFGNYSWERIDYGYVPRTWNLMKRSVTAKVRLRNSVAGHILRNTTDTSTTGFQLAFGGTNQLQWYEKNSLGPGIWLTPNNSIAVDTDYTIVMTRDRSIDPDADPIIYLNGTAATLTEASTPNGSVVEEDGLRLYVGSGNLDGILEDVRVYDRILTQEEVTEITNNEAYADVVTDGLVFQSHTINSDYGDAADFSGDLPDGAKLIDNVHRLVGERYVTPFSSRGWALRTTPNNEYLAVGYSPDLELFVAVGHSAGTTTHIMTSRNGKDNWTAQTSPDLNLYAVAWSPELGLFVATGDSGAIVTSPDGETWTQRTAPASNQWRAVTWSPELGLFVSVSISGTVGQRGMTSPDGITWTLRDAAGGEWVTWVADLGLFISGGSGDATIQTSPDGITWTSRATPVTHAIYGIDYSPELGMVVAVGDNGAIITSHNGIHWTQRTSPGGDGWKGVAWSSHMGVFVAVTTSSNQSAMYSTDGINWSYMSSPGDYGWYGITYSSKLQRFVAVQYLTSNTNRVMTF
jgi:hypothetical protein